jgi:hypothetical protein
LSLERFNQEFQERIRNEIVSKAKEGRISVIPDSIVFSSRDDLFIASGAAEGIEKLSDEDLKKGATVGIFYLSKDAYLSSEGKSGIRQGFYTLKATLTADSTSELQVLDSGGNVVARASATRSESTARTAAANLRLDASIDWEKVCGSAMYGQWYENVCYYFKTSSI